MRASLKALLSNVIDYAGMFPPARLGLDEAASNYLCYQRSPYAWMLGRFVCPAELLPQLRESPHWAAVRRYPLALIGPPDSDADDYVKRLTDDLAIVQTSSGALAESARTRNLWSFEFKFSLRALSRKLPDAPWFFDLPSIAQQMCDEVFLEVPLRTESDAGRLAPHVGTALGSSAWGLKFRTSGSDADMIPAVKHLATAIRLCCRYEIRFKLTGGLHQPLRHFDESLGTLAHGFLNLLCAAVLSHVHRLGEPQIADVLKEESPAAFDFSEGSLRWRDFTVITPEIEKAREQSMVSFGSCSFDEPVQGLKALGLIE